MVVHHLDSIAYVKVVAFVWYHWDAILTLGDEVDFIWRRGWTSRSTWSIGLFLLIRAITVALLVSGVVPLAVSSMSPRALTHRLGRCHLLASLNSSGSFVLAFLVSIILQSRIYVMYQRSRLILISNGILCLLAALVSALIITLFFPARHDDPMEAMEGNSDLDVPCYSTNDPRFTLCLVPPLIYVVYLSALALWKLRAYRLTHPHPSPHRNSTGDGHGEALMNLLVQSNVAFLGLIMAAVVVVICLWTAIKIAPVATSLEIMVAAVGLGGTRLIITLRKEVLSHPLAALHTHNTVTSIGENALIVTHVVNLPSLGLGWEMSDLRSIKAPAPRSGSVRRLGGL